MTTIRPQIIRADTLDLQDSETPSAKDHTRQPTHPAPLGLGPAAPHQDAEIRHVEEERTAEEHHLADAWASGGLTQDSSDSYDDSLESPRRDVHTRTGTPYADSSSHQYGGDELDTTDTDAEDHPEEELMDDKISSSPSIDDEDIDFEFVYALHNFVATVDGQANATKGDTMVLLDDSNSYWWLVRVVKDSSIGYLPAEHIETPTERLARLNKHRNIDLSATMLGDNAEKSKNPLKKAMRRRNAKAVSFTTPTYFEPSGMDWSDNEHENDDSIITNDAQGRRKGNHADRSDLGSGESVRGNSEGPTTANSLGPEDARNELERDNSNDGTIDGQGETGSRTRNGTMRNTDSFFKDDAAGTKKISLTPDLLREEAGNASPRSVDSVERPGSAQDVFDQMGRTSPTSDKAREEKRRKEKKPNMLSGLFKRKDKKIKVDEAAGNVVVRQDDAGSITSTTSDSGRESPSGRASPSTLIPRLNLGIKSSKTPTSASSSPLGPTPNNESERLQSLRGRASPSPSPANSAMVSPMNPQRTIVENVPKPEVAPIAPINYNPPQPTREPPAQPVNRSDPPMLDGTSSATRDPLADERENTAPRVEHQAPAPSRPTAQMESTSRATDQIMHGMHTNSVPRTDTQQPTTVPEPQPAPTKPSTPAPPVTSLGANPPYADSSTDSEPKSSTEDSTGSMAATSDPLMSTSTSSPATTPAPATPQQEVTEPVWDDAALRDYLDSSYSNDVKDLLVVVHDRTGVVPLAMDHPTMLDFGFHEHKKSLDDMSTRLDALLDDLLTRRVSAREKVGV